jgi:uncharacterized protein YggE
MMEKSVKISAIIAGSVLILVLIGVYLFLNFSSLNPSNSVTTVGLAEINVIPDKVSIHFGAESSGESAKEASMKNSIVVDEIITNLVKEGFSKQEIQTTGYNVYEDVVWTNYGKKSHGYKAVHSIILRVNSSETSKIGRAVDSGINANAILNYINFELSQELENKYKAEAIELAARDSRVKAESLARGVDKKIGRLISIKDSGFGYQPWVYYEKANTGGEDSTQIRELYTSIQPSEQVISASVTATYSLK